MSGTICIRTDCVSYLNARSPQLPAPKLIIADAPYNFGQQYADYKDRVAADKYDVWTGDWLRACDKVLHPQGSLWVFCPDEHLAITDLICRKTLNLTRRNMICWAFTFGQKAQKSFTRSKCFILYYVKDPANFTFRLDRIAVPSARQLVYKDKRAAGLKPPDDVWMLLAHQLEPYMTPDKDIWLQSRVCGTFKERQPHSPNQLPEPLIERIVKACSDPGDLVLDPFLGSGVTGVVCKKLNRPFLGLDISRECVVRSKQRISKVVQDSKD